MLTISMKLIVNPLMEFNATSYPMVSILIYICPPNFDSAQFYPLLIFNDGEGIFNLTGWNLEQINVSLHPVSRTIK